MTESERSDRERTNKEKTNRETGQRMEEQDGRPGGISAITVREAGANEEIARRLAQAAQVWCEEKGIKSLTVCCAPCDEGMYQRLGFDMCLGRSFAWIGEAERA
ncbi:MAG: GNAT family N-acetyltransferase [Lachnospiraceae bacterium]|jgi:hypothetical protein|nr:GNAT family N-acetyltransferase [Lachnospiraceae bacterium]